VLGKIHAGVLVTECGQCAANGKPDIVGNGVFGSGTLCAVECAQGEIHVHGGSAKVTFFHKAFVDMRL